MPGSPAVLAAPFLSSYHYTVGPLAAVGAVLVALGASRWVFSTSHREQRSASATARRDFGLLVPVASLADRGAVEQARSVLTAAGLRATVAEVPAGRGPVRVSADGHVQEPETTPAEVHLLVFPADLDRARALLAGA